ncbi:EAL domain-containing protein [Acidovorax sp. CF316]|uniref:EAL domain-containing protein n=1 Tax=Acidovorax sp. CF316 TaxID=1144317 RepID=UPI0026F3DDBB|nr:EAL domain-containing protein [Acidovorax sp. CF316]
MSSRTLRWQGRLAGWLVGALWALLPVCASTAAPVREVRVGVYANEPTVFMNQHGRPAGIFVDLLNLVAERERWTLRYVPCELRACLDDLQNGRLDLVPDAPRAQARVAQFDFTALPLVDTWSAVYRLPSLPIRSVVDLDGKRVAVQRGTLQRDHFLAMTRRYGLQVMVVEVDSPEQAFSAVGGNNAEAAISNHLFGQAHAPGQGLVDAGIVLQPGGLYVAAGKDRNPELLAAIDKRSAQWRDGSDASYAQVMRRWVGAPPASAIGRPALWALAALLLAGALAVLAVFVWRRRVRGQSRRWPASEHKFGTILDSVEAFIYIKDMQHRYLYANQHMLALRPDAADGLIGGDDSAIFDAATVHQLIANDRLVLERGERIEVEETNTFHDGSVRTYLSVKIPLRHTDGSIHALCGISTDITDHQGVAESLQIAAIVFESFEGMVVTGPDQCILQANTSYARLSGYTVEELVGKTPALLQSGRHDQTFYRTMHETLQSVGSWQGEVWNRRKDGEVYPAWITITAVRSAQGAITHYVGTQTDISSRKAAEEEIRLLAFYDPLTGLPNRRLMADRLQHSLAASARTGTGGALLFVDMDNFKDLNDTQGHEIGDELLRQVAARLGGCVRNGDTVARLGGDEFVLLLEGLSALPHEAASQAEIVGRKVLQALGQSYQLGGHAHHSSCSIGVTLYADPHTTVDELLKRGDMAMYQAKGAGRNTLRFFDPRTQAAVTARTALEAGLREALREGQFLLHYQPQISRDHGMVGAEALLRWEHPERGLVSPAEFVPVAEACGLIVPLGAWILRAACLQLVEWGHDAATAHWTVAVNVSALQFRHPHFVEEVVEVLKSTGANPLRLKLELTESLLLDDVEDIIRRMTTLRALGVRFSLDDFGTGYSSLSYLKRLPLDQLKIDQSFVRDLLTDPNDAAIARTIVNLAHSLDLGVIAEGVETLEQRDMLASVGCLHYQGYLFGRPAPASALPRIAAQVVV